MFFWRRWRGVSIPGGTLAGRRLRRDTLQNISFTVGLLSKTSSDSEKGTIKVIDTKVLEPPRDPREGWVEQWTVSRDGDQVDYRVEYKGDGSGGYFINTKNLD